MKIIRTICTLLFGVAVLLFFGLAYPHHLHYQEQYQLFFFDSNYVWEIVKLPGGLSDLLGRFCTQFFLFAWVGAAIIALLLSLVQLLTLRQACSRTSQTTGQGGGWLYGLSFVPSFLLWLFLLDENALLGGVWAVLLTLLASWSFDRLPSGWVRRISLIAAIPILYWMVGPVCVLFFLLQAPWFKGKQRSASPLTSLWYFGVFVLLAVMLFILASYIPVPAEKLWFGIHYHRYPTVFPTLLWAAALSVFVLALLACVFHHFLQTKNTKSHSVQNKNFQSSARPAGTLARARIFNFQSSIFNLQSSIFNLQSSIFLFVAVVMGWLVWNNSNFRAEKVMQYDFMARHQQWNRILETINVEKPNNQIGVTVQNLALAMRGMLLDHMLDYHQNGISGLLPDVETDATSPLPTAEVFYQLGMINVAQRSVFEAQEAILDFQKSGRCYKRLAQTNLINGNYEVARKYLLALQKTLFYKDWANETLPLLGDEKAIANHPEYGHLRKMAYKDDFFFSDHVTPEMLQSLYYSNKDNSMAYQYLLAYYVLTGDREGYNNFISNKQ
ncbi:MAG: hypothetical protein J5548_03375 [Prevotella sp.]|nr:hypothetical protein [Prevotella sp.]